MATSIPVTGEFYLVGVLYNPTEAERIEGIKREVVVEPRYILADDPQAAHNKAIMLVAAKGTEDEVDYDPDRCAVFVTKPF